MMLAPIVALTAAAAFSPAPGATYIYRIEQTRTVDGRTQRYVLIRQLIFRPVPGGWLAELRFRSATGDDAAEAAAFGRMAAALGAKPIRFRLDPAGTVVAVEDAAAVWDALVLAVASGDPGRPAAHALMTFPQAGRPAFLASMLAPLIGVADLARPLGTRAIRVPGGAPGGAAVQLPGEEIVSRATDGFRDVSLSAAGDTPGARAGAVRLAEHWRIDPMTALVVERRETRRMTISGKQMTIVTTTTLNRPGN